MSLNKQPRPVESVWDYPRPPRLEDTHRHVQVTVNGTPIAETRRAKRVLETGHPPVYYIPPEDVRMDLLQPSARHSYCEWKGTASYYSLEINGASVPDAAWFYPEPTPRFARGHIAFYPRKVEAFLDGERVQPQAGNFYGGWITHEISGAK